MVSAPEAGVSDLFPMAARRHRLAGVKRLPAATTTSLTDAGAGGHESGAEREVETLRKKAVLDVRQTGR